MYLSAVEVKGLFATLNQPIINLLAKCVKYDDETYYEKAVAEVPEVEELETLERRGQRDASVTPARKDSRGRPLAPARVEKAYYLTLPTPGLQQLRARTPLPKRHVSLDSPDFFLDSPPLAHSTPTKEFHGVPLNRAGQPTQGNTHRDSILSAIRESPEWELTNTAGQSVLVAQDGSYDLTHEDIKTLINERDQLRQKVLDFEEEIEEQVAGAIDISLSYLDHEFAQRSELSAEEKDNFQRQVSEANDKARRLEKKLETVNRDLEKVNNYANELKIAFDDAQKGRKYMQGSNLKLRADARDAIDRYTKLKANQVRLEDKIKMMEYDNGVKSQKLRLAKEGIEMLEEELIQTQELKATIDEQAREIEDLKMRNDQLNVEQSLLERTYIGAGRRLNRDSSRDSSSYSGKTKGVGSVVHSAPVVDLANVVGGVYKGNYDSGSWQALEQAKKLEEQLTEAAAKLAEKVEELKAQKESTKAKATEAKVRMQTLGEEIEKRKGELEEQHEIYLEMETGLKDLFLQTTQLGGEMQVLQKEIEQLKKDGGGKMQEIEELQSELASIEDELKEAIDSRDQTGAELEKLKREWAKGVAKELEYAKGKVAQLTELGSKRKEWFDGEIAHKEEMVVKLEKAMYSSEEQVKGLSTVIQQLQGSIDKQQSELKKKWREIEHAEVKAKRYKEQAMDLEAKRKEDEREAQILRESKRTQESTIQSLEMEKDDAWNRVNKLEDIVDTSKDDQLSKLADQASKIAGLERRLSEMVERWKKGTKNILLYEVEKRKNEELERKKERQAQIIEELMEERKKQNEQLLELQERLDKMITRNEEGKGNTARVKQLENWLKIAKGEVVKYKKSVEELEGDLESQKEKTEPGDAKSKNEGEGLEGKVRIAINERERAEKRVKELEAELVALGEGEKKADMESLVLQQSKNKHSTEISELETTKRYSSELSDQLQVELAAKTFNLAEEGGKANVEREGLQRQLKSIEKSRDEAVQLVLQRGKEIEQLKADVEKAKEDSKKEEACEWKAQFEVDQGDIEKLITEGLGNLESSHKKEWDAAQKAIAQLEKQLDQERTEVTKLQEQCTVLNGAIDSLGSLKEQEEKRMQIERKEDQATIAEHRRKNLAARTELEAAQMWAVGLSMEVEELRNKMTVEGLDREKYRPGLEEQSEGARGRPEELEERLEFESEGRKQEVKKAEQEMQRLEDVIEEGNRKLKILESRREEIERKLEAARVEGENAKEKLKRLEGEPSAQKPAVDTMKMGPEEKLDTARTANDKAIQELKKLEGELDAQKQAADATKKDLEEQLEATRIENEKATRDVEQLQTALIEARSRVEEVKLKLAELNKVVPAKREILIETTSGGRKTNVEYDFALKALEEKLSVANTDVAQALKKVDQLTKELDAKEDDIEKKERKRWDFMGITEGLKEKLEKAVVLHKDEAEELQEKVKQLEEFVKVGNHKVAKLDEQLKRARGEMEWNIKEERVKVLDAEKKAKDLQDIGKDQKAKIKTLEDQEKQLRGNLAQEGARIKELEEGKNREMKDKEKQLELVRGLEEQNAHLEKYLEELEQEIADKTAEAEKKAKSLDEEIQKERGEGFKANERVKELKDAKAALEKLNKELTAKSKAEKTNTMRVGKRLEEMNKLETGFDKEKLMRKGLEETLEKTRNELREEEEKVRKGEERMTGLKSWLEETKRGWSKQLGGEKARAEKAENYLEASQQTVKALKEELAERIEIEKKAAVESEERLKGLEASREMVELLKKDVEVKQAKLRELMRELSVSSATVQALEKEKEKLKRGWKEMEGEFNADSKQLETSIKLLTQELQVALHSLEVSEANVKELKLAVQKLTGQPQVKQGMVLTGQLNAKDKEISGLKNDIESWIVTDMESQRKITNFESELNAKDTATKKLNKELAEYLVKFADSQKKLADTKNALSHVQKELKELKEEENAVNKEPLTGQVTDVNKRITELRGEVRNLQNIIERQKGTITGHVNTNTQLSSTVTQLRSTITELQGTIAQISVDEGDVLKPRRKLDMRGVQREAIIRALKDLTPEELERLDPKLWPATPYENVTVWEFMFWPIMELIRFTIWNIPWLLRWWQRKAKEAGMKDWEIYEPEWEIPGRPAVRQREMWIRGGATPSLPGTPLEEVVSDGEGFSTGSEASHLLAPPGSPRLISRFRGGSGPSPPPEPINTQQQHLHSEDTKAELGEGSSQQQRSSTRDTGSPPAVDLSKYFKFTETPTLLSCISPHKKCSSPHAWLRAILWVLMFLLLLGSLFQQWVIVAQTEEIKQQWAKPNMVVVRDWLSDRRPRMAGWCEDGVCYCQEWWWVRIVREWIIEWLGLDMEFD
ncbi:hypothetical protein BGX38DRAFT_1230860 [Terfezia claveryi]|nr:hypothetical protein BGX38DRAFT_1230860 [Terfezia claveryi]